MNKHQKPKKHQASFKSLLSHLMEPNTSVREVILMRYMTQDLLKKISRIKKTTRDQSSVCSESSK